jgi:hypothetical protein
MDKTDTKRIEDVKDAAAALPAALAAALAEPEHKAHWELVEEYGAIIHRRARLLAGKPRGG